MINSINWFEIPVLDFNRAKKFYETLYGEEIMEMPIPNMKYGKFPTDTRDGVAGAIVQCEDFDPSTKGTIVYLNGGDDLSVALSKVEGAGGKILMPKTSIGGNGFIAQFIETEGNKVALHSRN